jgi:hypothetical protein
VPWDLAASIEIAHSASIVLDDIIDGDDQRRGQRAAHMVDGQSKTVLGMVGALSMPYSLVSRHGGVYTELLANTHQAMVSGEISELSPIPDHALKERYETIIAQKTGQLFSLATQFGAMAAKCPKEQVDLLLHYGMMVGKAIQQADDIDDMMNIDNQRAPRHRSEILLGRMLGASDQEGADLSCVRHRAISQLMGRLREADHALAIALQDSAGNVPHDPKLAACLRSAPAEMAAMMLREGVRPSDLTKFGGPLKRPKYP